MKLIEYLFGDETQNISFDEEGNLCWRYEDKSDIDDKVFYFYDVDDYKNYGIIKINKSFLEHEIIIPKDFKYDDNVRRPYYRMRGRPISEEQAFDIIRRTDNFFYFERLYKDDFICTINFINTLIVSNHYPRCMGWVHTDGLLGLNDITSKYPEMEDFIHEWLVALEAFPYLDLVIAVTNWDEVPLDCWSDLFEDDRRDFELPEYDDDFYKAIVLGIWVHDKTVQILAPSEAIAKYKEYDSLYGKERDRFRSEYYDENGIFEIDEKYLRRCIEANGFDYKESISKVHRFVVKDILGE